MQGVLPGSPVSGMQAICTGIWNKKRFIAYITGKTVVVLNSPHTLLQAIYDESEDELEGIAFDEINGKIAVCSKYSVRVYRPHRNSEDGLKWCLQGRFSFNETETVSLKTISWGSSDELLVGSSQLTLFSTLNVPTIIWRKKLANCLRFADFSYDSAFIASAGNYDRYVKIWRRQSYECDETRFDFSYLSHPAAVTNVYWRRPYHTDQTIVNVLYTTCADQILRIWAASDIHTHSTKHLQLWNQIDLIESIKPRSLSNCSKIRFSFIIDSRDFMMATEQTIQDKNSDDITNDHALAHLIEIAYHSPEICIVLDDLGHMSAWGFESISCKKTHKANIFNIAHVDGLFLGLPNLFEPPTSQIRCYNYFSESCGGFIFLIHHFDGSIEVFEGSVANLFDASPRNDRLVSKGILTGHSSNISGLLRDMTGKALLSRANCNECIVWRQSEPQGGESLHRQSIIKEKEKIHQLCLLENGEFIVSMAGDKISLWDTRDPRGFLLETSMYSFEDRPYCMTILPIVNDLNVGYVVSISSKMNGIVWKINLPSKITTNNKIYDSRIQQFCHFKFGDPNAILGIIPISSANFTRTQVKYPNNFDRDVVLSFSKSGSLRSWTARLKPTLKTFDWLQTCFIETGISEPALIAGNYLRKVAVVNSNKTDLTILDMSKAHVEHTISHSPHDTIQGLDWISNAGDQSILAVQFSFRVATLAQIRYDYLNRKPSWAYIKEFSIRDLTPNPTVCLSWLNNGDYVVGAGGQMLIADKTVNPSITKNMDVELLCQDSDLNIIQFVARMNSPLPVYHPQFLVQCIFADKFTLVTKVVLKLYNVLKYYVEADSIDDHLGIELEAFYTNDATKSMSASNILAKNPNVLSYDNNQTIKVTAAHAYLIAEKLAKISLPRLSKKEQTNLVNIIEYIATIDSNRSSLDEGAIKFQFSFFMRRSERNEPTFLWREINWAYHSKNHDILIDIISRQSHGKPLWENARQTGLFMWITDHAKLVCFFVAEFSVDLIMRQVDQFEIIARNEYSKSDIKNPIDCTLFYFALRKKSVLQGLWRIATWNREQAATIKLLSNNFQEKKWKTAAMKNAYVLLGKHRYNYAAAFFLLADRLNDCVNVILNQLKDLQLAIAVTRVYEGDQSLALKELLENKVLPLASQDGNRWLASWTFWMLRKRDMSLQVLIPPAYTSLNTSWAPCLQPKSFLDDDPALVTFYSQLRLEILNITVPQISQELEYKLILHYAKLFARMGCGLLVLNLLRNWKFLHPNLAPNKGVEILGIESISRKDSSVTSDMPLQQPLYGMKTGGYKPSVNLYEEPDSNSLLDRFGF